MTAGRPGDRDFLLLTPGSAELKIYIEPPKGSTMTRNRRGHAKDSGRTSQGVRDLNSMGPRKPRPGDDPPAQELALNDRLGRAGHGRHKMGLPDKA